MSEIVACYVVANEAAHLAESIRSCKAYVDRYVIIDSLFTTSPLEGVASTDGTRQVAERACAGKPLDYVVPGRRLTEPEARNEYLARTRGDWVLIIDGDEQLLGDHQSVLALADTLRRSTSGVALDVAVYTVAVNANGNAPDLGPEVYDTAPLITTVGRQARLVRNVPELELGYRISPIGLGHTMYDRLGRYVGALATPVHSLFIVNHHTRQPYAGYLADYEWETRAITEARGG